MSVSPELLVRDHEKLAILEDLALDLRIIWSYESAEVWRRIDADLWNLTRNPWAVLRAASPGKINELAQDGTFLRHVGQLADQHREYFNSTRWFLQNHSPHDLTCAAYFCMEFGLSDLIPIYSGGLGNVAGDQLKAASDLGVPVVGVGLLYQRGYFRQMLDVHGEQIEYYPFNSPELLPITLLRDSKGELVRVDFDLPGYKLRLRVWEVRVGRVRLYLLDSNDPANLPMHRGITSELYGGGPEVRFAQELVLGIGGWRLLRRLGLHPEVCHLNEGHAAFAVLERARAFMSDTGKPFDVALAVTRAGNLFTTHTPVTAGFDRFDPELVRIYLEGYAREQLGIDFSELLALGRMDPNDRFEPFNMAYLAIRGSGATNAVSRLHAQVSRRIFQPLFPKWSTQEIPVDYVTNGVHTPSWESTAASELWSQAAGKDRWFGATENVGESIRGVSDEALWNLRGSNRAELVNYVRGRIEKQTATIGGSPSEIERARHVFDPNALTIGFARRFATYKRPNLLLQDPDRLARVIKNSQYPVQFAIAGKAHPADAPGKRMIREWLVFLRRYDIQQHAVFLADYDLELGAHLVRGVDLWVNTPRRPWEASGTSGMKILANGGLNLSVLDGWWAEAYSPEVGWAIGDARLNDDSSSDEQEAGHLYDLLENEVIPAFYDRDVRGIPTRWVAKMRESMARLTPNFSANRAVRQYTDEFYVTSAREFRRREADRCAIGERIVAWKRMLDRRWNQIRFGDAHVETNEVSHSFTVQVYFDEIDPDVVSVELYAEPVEAEGSGAERIEMARSERLIGAIGGYNFRCEVPATRPASDYTARVVGWEPDAVVPLEAAHILWQR